MNRAIADAGWRFDNSYARLPEPLFTRTLPTAAQAPAVVLVNGPLADDLGLDRGILAQMGAGVFTGSQLPPGADPIA